MDNRESHKITIIVPLFNAEKTVDETIESVRKQDIGFDNIELILIDDHSTDKTYSICEKYQKKHDNVILFQTKKNTGYPGKGRNIGLDNATSPYVMFLDDDDTLFPSACKSLYEAITKNEVDCVKAPFYRNDTLVDRFAEDGMIEGIYEFEDVYWQVMPNIWNAIYRNSVIQTKKIRFVENAYAEDDAFLLTYLTVSPKILYLKKPILKHYIRESNLSLNFLNGKWWRRNTYISYNDVIDYMERTGNQQQFKKVIDRNSVFVYILEHMLNESEDLAVEEIEEGIKNWQKAFGYSYTAGGNLHTLGSKILFRDLHDCRTDLALKHFFQIRNLYQQRKKEVGNILASKTWVLSDLMLHPQKLFKGTNR